MAASKVEARDFFISYQHTDREWGVGAFGYALIEPVGRRACAVFLETDDEKGTTPLWRQGRFRAL